MKRRYLGPEHNMPGKLITTTPIWILTKREAILQWLKDNSYDTYVIIDDDDLKLEHQYKTNIRTGLTNTNAEEIVKMLTI